MNKVTNIRTKTHQGPRVPVAYVAKGRDVKSTRSSEREVREEGFLSEAAKERLAHAGLILAGAVVVAASVYGLAANQMSDSSKSGQTRTEVEQENQESTATTEVPERGDPDYNPGIYTSGSEDVDGL